MADWQTPKTDWVTNPKNPVADDFNRIEGNIDFLKNDIETKKELIVDAINDMNQTAEVTDTHAQLASKIRDISKDANAAVGDVEKGKTFYSDGQKKTGTLELTGNAGTNDVLSEKTFYNTDLKTKRTGTMTNREAVILTPEVNNVTIPSGYHNGNGYVVGDQNLKQDNIKDGVSIFNVVGTFVGSFIKSIQQGVVAGSTSSYSISISPVDRNYSVVICECGGGERDSASRYSNYATLDADDLLVIHNVANSGSRSLRIGWKVIEFEHKIIKSLQKGQDSVTTTTDITISPVDVTKSLVFVWGILVQGSGTVNDKSAGRLTGATGILTSSDNLQISGNNDGISRSFSWQVLEFV